MFICLGQATKNDSKEIKKTGQGKTHIQKQVEKP